MPPKIDSLTLDYRDQRWAVKCATLSTAKMGPLLLPWRLCRGPHLDDCARLNGSQRLCACREVML